MSLSEILPQLKTLSQLDKLRLLHFLTGELLDDACRSAEENQSDGTGFEAAAILAKALAEHQAEKHG